MTTQPCTCTGGRLLRAQPDGTHVCSRCGGTSEVRSLGRSVADGLVADGLAGTLTDVGIYEKDRTSGDA